MKGIKIIPEKKKKKTQQYGREESKNLQEDKKPRLAEYRKIYYKI